MADDSGSNSFLGVIVGILLVLVVIGGFFIVQGGNFGGNKGLDVKVEAPQIEAPKVPTGG